MVCDYTFGSMCGTRFNVSEGCEHKCRYMLSFYAIFCSNHSSTLTAANKAVTSAVLDFLLLDFFFFFVGAAFAASANQTQALT